MVSAVCEAFGCTPDAAERQDAELVRAVLDYRNAGIARDLLNQGTAGFDRMAKTPQLGELLLGMVRAQTGNTALSLGEVMGSMSDRADEKGES